MIPPQRKRPRTWLPIGVALLLAVTGITWYVLHRPTDATRQDYAGAARDAILELEAAGLSAAKEVSPDDGNPFLRILVPSSGEISDTEVDAVVDLIVFAATTFENHPGLKADDLTVTFSRPVSHEIILANRPAGFPAPIGMLSEFTITDQAAGVGWSVVNIAGTEKDFGRQYTIDWAVVQAVCLAYAAYANENADPACNILAANAAAGWAGIDRELVERTLGSGGSTGLEYPGSQNLEFRFIDFVYEEFSP